MWELLDLLRSIPHVELWMLGISAGVTLVMTALGITLSGTAKKPEEYIELTTLKITGPLTPEEIQKRIAEGRVAEIKE